ncbi:LacI family DNA-binding transcriptional regulator [Paenibacillus turicensis]|uniref:LacI family DNA-binding transcriptional regulator n=1 Tax=Paenibacillus turicensis TaxID=160487 RepID=UPI003D2B0192
MNNTIADIAKLAGVAKSTVSRYLNGGSVSKNTSEQIEQVIKATGYVPNMFAQSLKAKVTNIIGTVVPRLDSFATSQTLIGIDDTLRALRYQMLISNTSQDASREIEAMYAFSRQKVAGIILLAAVITNEHLRAIDDIGIPVLLVGQQHPQLYSLIHDDYNAAYELGKYVLSQGHHRIAYLGVTEQDIAVGVQRKSGFHQAVQEAMNMDLEASKYDVRYFETSFKMSDARLAAENILEQFSPSIIVCATDNIALGVINTAYAQGRSIPHDLSVTGFGNYDITAVVHPPLTTVEYAYREAGKTAAENIVRLVEQQSVPKITTSKCKLVPRESVDKI